METIIIQAKSANLTDDQFYELCAANKKIRFERDKNKNITIMPPTGYHVNNFEVTVLSKVIAWNEKSKTGHVTGLSGGYYLPDESMFAPDVAWTKKERIDKLSDAEQDKFLYLCPDFIIEVHSRTDTLKQLKEKMNTWIANGCRLAWLIDLENKTTYVYRPEEEATEHPFTDTLSGQDVLPDFELKLSDIIS